MLSAKENSVFKTCKLDKKLARKRKSEKIYRFVSRQIRKREEKQAEYF